MSSRIRFFLIILMIFISESFADDSINKSMVFSVGMVTKSFQENESSIQGENKQEIASGQAQVIAANIQYNFSSSLKRSIYSNITLPLLPSGDNSFFSGGFGVQFFLTELANDMKYRDGSDSIKHKPRYGLFWGLETNLDYLVYSTETQKKSDLVFDLGLNAGGSYRLSQSFNIRALAGLSRGVGVNTSVMGMRFLVGLIYQLD